MTWQEFCKNNKIGSLFHGVSLETSIFDEDLLSFAKEYRIALKNHLSKNQKIESMEKYA